MSDVIEAWSTMVAVLRRYGGSLNQLVHVPLRTYLEKIDDYSDTDQLIIWYIFAGQKEKLSWMICVWTWIQFVICKGHVGKVSFYSVLIVPIGNLQSFEYFFLYPYIYKASRFFLCFLWVFCQLTFLCSFFLQFPSEVDAIYLCPIAAILISLLSVIFWCSSE